MSTPPPPSPPGGPGGFNQPPGYQPPPGYQAYSGQPMTPTTNSGMAIASLVLSLVGIIPCFWALQIPGLLGTIFGFIGLKQTKDGTRKGRGMAIAGLVIGIILLVIAAIFITYVATHECTNENGRFVCVDD